MVRPTESLAERVGVDPKTVGRWLSEGRIPHPRHRVSAAEVLGRDASDIWPETSRRRDPVWFRPWQETEREAGLPALTFTPTAWRTFVAQPPTRA